MDPTATLNEQLALAQTILADLTWCDADHELNAAAARLADLTQALDGWVRNGGSLPAPWHATARAADTYRIEVWDQGRWVLAPGEATGWSRAGALEVSLYIIKIVRRHRASSGVARTATQYSQRLQVNTG